jgi:hypothetical protein
MEIEVIIEEDKILIINKEEDHVNHFFFKIFI